MNRKGSRHHQHTLIIQENLFLILLLKEIPQ